MYFEALPQDTFDLILPILGNGDALEIFEKELSATLDMSTLEEPRHDFERWIDWKSNRRDVVVWPRISRLSTVPNGGLKLAVRFLMEELSHELDQLLSDDHEDEQALHIDGDLRLHEIMKRYVESGGRESLPRRAAECIELIPKVGEENASFASTIIPEFVAVERWTAELRAKRWRQHFEKTYRFLFARHSSEVGQMLAFKVLEDMSPKLPPEVIEMIGGTWCDQRGLSPDEWLAVRGSRRVLRG